jgi:two-component system, OmpR family, response regulator
MRLLVVEDNPSVSSLRRRGLECEGYTVDLAATGDDAIAAALATRYLAILLDVMIPGPDGFAVVRRLRQTGCWSPVLMLTARDRVEDRIAGLRAGADDYVCKPFSLCEVSARVHALTRRASYDRPNVLVVDDLTLDPATHEAAAAAWAIAISTKEYDLLSELMRHPGEVLTSTYLWEHLFGADVGREDRLVGYVERLRDKVDRRFGRGTIETVAGTGYRLRTDPSA